MDTAEVEKAYGWLLDAYSLYVTEKFIARELGDDERSFVRTEAGSRWNRAQEHVREHFGEPVACVAKSLLWCRKKFPQFPPRLAAA